MGMGDSSRWRLGMVVKQSTELRWQEFGGVCVGVVLGGS